MKLALCKNAFTIRIFMKMFGSIIWITFGGFIIALEYFIAGLILCCTIIGIPFGFQVIKIGMFTFLPFGKKAILIETYNQHWLVEMMTLIWLIIGALWIALTHIALCVLFGVTIIGMPFAIQHFKLIPVAFTPFGRNIVRA